MEMIETKSKQHLGATWPIGTRMQSYLLLTCTWSIKWRGTKSHIGAGGICRRYITSRGFALGGCDNPDFQLDTDLEIEYRLKCPDKSE